ncbi:hypothetical protein U1Q18_052636 [Sarracenia purpurea var. burkii]
MVPESNVEISGGSYIGRGTESGAFVNSTSSGANGKIPFEIDSFSPNTEFEWDNYLLKSEIQKRPSIGGGLKRWSQFFWKLLWREVKRCHWRMD